MSVCSNCVPDFRCRLSRTVFLAWSLHMLSTAPTILNTRLMTPKDRDSRKNAGDYHIFFTVLNGISYSFHVFENICCLKVLLIQTTVSIILTIRLKHYTVGQNGNQAKLP